jgi:hypothetical protein
MIFFSVYSFKACHIYGFEILETFNFEFLVDYGEIVSDSHILNITSKDIGKVEQ